MAKLGNIFFNRTLNQFLECQDLSSSKATTLTKRIGESVNENLDKILETITRVDEPHKEALKNICRESVEGFSEDFFLDVLSHDQTVFRVAASDILSHSSSVDTKRLFSQLHEPDAPLAEIIEVLRGQKEWLKPEEVINNALRLDSSFSVDLMKLASECGQPVDLSKLSLQPDKINNPILKITLLNYLGSVNEPKVPLLLSRFLKDSNKVVILEALKSLNRITIAFDASILLPLVEATSGVEREQTLNIIKKQANADLVPHLSDYLASKTEELNEFFAGLVVAHSDVKNFEKFLQRLEIEDDWTRQQSIVCVQKLADQKISEVARKLTSHEQDFVRSTAQQLVMNLLGDKDLKKIEEFALSDNWQVRERAIQSLSKSANRAAIGILKTITEKYPDDTVLVLRAVRQLGFGKGLEIAFSALKHEQANVQRAALEAIEVVTGEKHAANVRDTVLWNLSSLTPELKEYAKQLISQITKDFGLPDIQIDKDMNTFSGAVDVPVVVGNPVVDLQAAHTSPLDKLVAGEVWMERYHILAEIGRGAMGRVILVEDDMVDESLILKFMLPELTIEEDSAERFKREVKYARKISHRNVIRVHDILLKDGLCAISMEYFESQGLESVLSERKIFDNRDGLKVLFQISSGMAAAHEQGVIHRDLKPSNVLINDAGQVKIVDFGIASAGASSESTLTQQGAIIGSPAYLAPERADGNDSDERCDIYSLGVLAYYMFSGRLPYSGRPLQVLEQHRKGNAEPVKKINPAVTNDISALIVRMMAVDPKARPQSMIEVRDMVKELLEEK
ncbi:MAG: serine/threonine-protein kinase [Pseudomonadota bacterium]